ncbi:hypothetical protein C488_19497 [Natrinema pellirubrum DSM 15624]|uniref:Membrane protein n=1 Tax=Natrinema pellirubrum (strain DSM 15624 / CIP 106293 / JCM 10476 / NCIMB 786 / 157) TaxID=797303 RepID=L0JHM3_NATP1|nr:DUF106 domain-containing protein [Natrinema pellirubrum]AGB30082.1 putative membrane protein [Natrinema pellirubrum DSM 15624]ELY70097.1 hypothetical protein C488_19497 [Natrinema pellirubrum DSM 15624]
MPIDQLVTLLENESIREALMIVYERSDGGTEELEWRDVRDALSSEQWGTLIEQEVLVSAGSGFAIAEPGRVERLLGGDDPSEDAGTDGIESPSWTTADKAAGAFALLLFAGYWNTGIRDIVASVESAIFGPVAGLVPFHLVIVFLAVVTGFYSTVLQSRLLDREKLEQYKQRMTDLQERTAAAKERGDEEALERLQEERMAAAGDQLGMFKLQFRPMVWIMLLTIPVFLWLRWKVRGGHLGTGETGLVVPIAGAVTWQQSLVGPMQTWLVWYFCCSMAARQLIQKVFGLRTGTSS